VYVCVLMLMVDDGAVMCGGGDWGSVSVRPPIDGDTDAKHTHRGMALN
jgi:hypothetical protein